MCQTYLFVRIDQIMTTLMTSFASLNGMIRNNNGNFCEEKQHGM